MRTQNTHRTHNSRSYRGPQNSSYQRSLNRGQESWGSQRFDSDSDYEGQEHRYAQSRRDQDNYASNDYMQSGSNQYNSNQNNLSEPGFSENYGSINSHSPYRSSNHAQNSTQSHDLGMRDDRYSSRGFAFNLEAEPRQNYSTQRNVGVEPNQWCQGYGNERSQRESGTWSRGIQNQYSSPDSTERRQGQFAGVGPKGYKRPDERIHEEVNEALYHDADIDASNIEIDVKEGVVTLSGTVENRRAKRCVEECVENLSGVKDVTNNLKVGAQSSTPNANAAASNAGSVNVGPSAGTGSSSSASRTASGRAH